MNAPTPRQPGSPSLYPSPAPSTEESPAEFFGLMGAVFAGAFVSGIAILFGEAITGTSGTDEFGICSMLYFMGGLICSLPLSILGITVWWVFSGRIHPGLFSVPCFFVPLAALITGVMIPSVGA